MKFAKVFLTALVMLGIAGDVQAADTATATATLTINVTRPSCDLTVPSSYNLGILTPGRKEHGDLNITWTCKGDVPVKTGMSVGIVNGTAVGDDKVYLMAGSQATGATLSLKDKKNGVLIKLTNTSTQDSFCTDDAEVTGLRTCTLIPVTEVASAGPFGLASATVKFAVVYL